MRRRDPDVSRAVLEDLYRYPRKHPLVTWLLWVTTGWLGGHRFYLERTGTGVLMLFTSGGLFVWWLIDGLRLNGMIEAFNEEQERRERLGLPPVALAFMPSLDRSVLAGPPAWAPGRGGRVRLAGDAFVLLIAGSALGAVSTSTGNFEGVVAILVLVVVTNMGARWEALARRPVFRALDRWSHRLRLFYHVNDPGGPLALLLRPVVGTMSAFFRKRARAEARLYLQLGAVFVLLFTLIDLAQAIAESGGTLVGSMRALAGEMGMTFVIIYAFASPIGATLTTHVLLHRSDRTVWVLSGITLLALALGLLS
ncbi:MAG: TM2 domain-containing protein [Gemmatimonadota bacterium]|nr:TM2 domain-containing protein [Gemmatimonadota bacterium]